MVKIRGRGVDRLRQEGRGQVKVNVGEGKGARGRQAKVRGERTG